VTINTAVGVTTYLSGGMSDGIYKHLLYCEVTQRSQFCITKTRNRVLFICSVPVLLGQTDTTLYYNSFVLF